MPAMSGLDEIDTRATTWYGKVAQSPPFPDEPALDCRIAPGLRSGLPTTLLLGALHVRGPHKDYYGGHLPMAVRVVACHLGTGRVYEADLSPPDAVPIRVATEEELRARSARPSSVLVHFNVDLPVLLGLPGAPGRYRVLAWLDDLVSPVLDVDIEPRPDRGNGAVRAGVPAGVVRTSVVHPAPEHDGITLALSPPGDDGALLVRGSAALPPRESSAGDLPALWVLACSHRERRFGWVALAGDDVVEGANAFELDALKLVNGSGTAQKIFVLALSPTLASAVLVATTG